MGVKFIEIKLFLKKLSKNNKCYKPMLQIQIKLFPLKIIYILILKSIVQFFFF